MAKNKYAIETAFSLIDKATPSLQKIGVKGNAIGKQLKKDFGKAQDQLDKMGKAAVKAGKAVAVAGVAAATAFAVKGVKDAIEFTTAFTSVATIANTTNISLKELEKQVLDLSSSTGVAATEISKYQATAISSGIDTADSVSFVATAMKVSKAAYTDAGVVIDGLTDIMNAYGLSASEAEKIAGQMFITTNAGKTSFEELNSSLSKILPTASRLNVGTDELFASIATLTNNSIETPKAVNGVKKILESVQKPTDSVAKAARRLGIDFSATALKSKGLAGFLEEIKTKTGGSEDAIISLFGSVDALNAINVLTVTGMEEFTATLGSMQNAVGAADDAYAKVMSTPAERWAVMSNKIKNAGINLGTALLPFVEKIVEKIDIFATKISEIDFEPIAEKITGVFDRVLAFAGILMDIIKIAWKFRNVIVAVVGVIALYRRFMMAAVIVLNGLKAAQMALKAVQLGVYLMTGNQTKALALYKAGTMGATTQTILFAARQKALQGINFVGTITKQGAAFVALKAQLIGAKIATIAFSVAQKAASIATVAMSGAMGVANALFVASPIGWIVLAIGALVAIIILCVKNWDKITASLKTAWEWVRNVASMIWEKLVGAFESLRETISRNSEKALAFLAVFTGPFGFIISIVKELRENWDGIVEAFKTDGIIEGFKKLGGVILSAVLAPIQGLLEILAKIPGVDKLLGPAVEKIQSFRDQLKGVEPETTFVQNVVPAGITTPVPNIINQTTTQVSSSAGIPQNTSTFDSQLLAASVAPPTRPMTTAEQYRYSETVNKDEVGITVQAENGTSARVTRQPKSPNINLVSSGGNR